MEEAWGWRGDIDLLRLKLFLFATLVGDDSGSLSRQPKKMLRVEK
jgi:hypothetical protein